jgi:hypothetical protein
MSVDSGQAAPMTEPITTRRPPHDQARRRRLVLALTALLVVLVLTATVLWWSGYRSSLQVIAHVGTPRCEGTEPTTNVEQGEVGGDFAEIAIPVRPDFVCTVPIKIENLSEHEVTVQRVTLGGGPDAGSSYRAQFIGGQRVHGEDADGGGADAIAELDQALGAGEVEVIDVRLVFRKSACMGEGTGEQTWPRIRVADQLARHDVIVGGFPRLEGTADADCSPERTR